MISKKTIEKALLITSLIVFAIFLFKLVSFINILLNYEIYSTGDTTNHMSRLFFLYKYGYHNLVPHWYNGFILLESYLPLFFFFGLPFYLFTQKANLAFILAIISMYILAFIVFYILGKTQKLSKIKTLFLTTIFIGNPLTIDYVFDIGRTPEFFSWLIFILLFSLLLYYKNKQLDKNFYLFYIITYSLILLSHAYILIISTLFLSTLFLIKSFKEKRNMLLATIPSLIITSFAWLPFLKVLKAEQAFPTVLNPLNELLTKDSIISYNSVILPSFLIIFTIYFISTNKKTRELIFYSFPIIIALLLLTRIGIFIPIINKAPPNAYNTFFIILSSFLFLKIKLTNLPKKLTSLFLVGIILIPAIFLTVMHFDKSSVDDTPKNIQLRKDMISLFPNINRTFIILGKEHTRCGNILAYGVIEYGLNTSHGEYPFAAPQEQLNNNLVPMISHFGKEFYEDCNTTLTYLKNLKTIQVLSFGEHCNYLNNCGLKEVEIKREACLYETNN